MMMKLLYLSPFVLAATLFLLQVVHGHQQQYCVKQTVYKESTKCDGTDSISGYMPVSNNPADSCHAFDMPDDLGPGSGAMYCDAQMRYHMDSYLGTKNCSAADADMMMQQMLRSDRCVGSILNMSVIVECLQGACPEEENLKYPPSMAARRRKLALKMHHSMLFQNHWTAMEV